MNGPRPWIVFASLATLLFVVPPAFAQPTDEEVQLEEEFIRSRAENGESHASGMRPESAR